MRRAWFRSARRAGVMLALGACVCGCESDLPTQRGATSVLDLFRQPTPAEAADMALDPYDAERRYRGTLLLANAPFAGESPYMQLFVDNLKDPDPGVRQAAVRAIANHGTPEQAMLLVDRLNDKDPGVRRDAAKGLQRLHNASAIDALIKARSEDEEDDPEVRAEAAGALGQYAVTRVVQALVDALGDQQLTVNRRALDSLRTLTGQDFSLSQAAWLSWLKDVKNPYAARGVYIYPVYRRSKLWWEHFPFVRPPPNETASTPAGFPRSFGG